MSDIHYAAGLFDGEGYVRISSRKSKTGEIMQVVAGVAMTDPEGILLMHSLFGGSLHTQNRTRANHKPLHTWVVSSKKANAFLRKIRPHLRVKVAQVDLAIEFQKSIDEWAHKLGNRYGFHQDRDAVFAHRRHIASEILRLKSVVKPLVTR